MRSLAALSLVSAMSCATSTTTKPAAPAKADAPPIAWQHWSAETFARAKREKRIVVVAVETAWCHWCHVMDEQTWSDPAVRALIAERFVAIREDADARPDLAERYADWGWPALALLSPDAEAITELRGFQEKTAFAELLRSQVAKLDRGEQLGRVAIASTASAAKSERDAIVTLAQKQLDSSYDDAQAGWGKVQKYPFYAPVEEALLRSFIIGDDAMKARALSTLTNEEKLIDPVDGGMFQYSLDGVWTAPHYEKLAEINGNALGSYALAYRATHDESYANAGRLIAKYVTTTLRDSSGAFYANQDADSGAVVGKVYYAKDTAGRAQLGAPPIDKHIYASHNGRIIAGLARFAAATHDDALLDMAKNAALVVDGACYLGKVAYRHECAPPTPESINVGVHLADQTAMGLAYLELYEATGDVMWRDRARSMAGVLARFRDEKAGGFFEHPATSQQFDLDVRKPIKTNAEAARFLLKLGRLDGRDEWIKWANDALDVFSNEAAVRDEGRTIGEYLLALEEAKQEPLHFAIASSTSDDAATKALYRAALDVPAPHRLVELVAPGAKYPDLGKPALYLCGATFCSPPIFDPALVATKAKPFLKPRT